MTPTPLDQALPAAREAVARFLDPLDRAGRVLVFCHFDADGLGAGAVLGRALPRLGFTDVQVVPSGRGESAFSDAARERLRALRPHALVVTDLGVHRDGVLPDVPTLYVDHHRPEGGPEGPVTVVSGYGWDPIPASAWLAWELVAPLADVDDLGWIAAVGAMSDLGDAAPWPALPALRKRYTAKWLREAVSLVNAARRASAFDVQTPLELLMEADGPRALAGDSPEADRLREYRDEVRAAVDAARRVPPVFSATEPWALLRLHSPCQIHPLIAQQWRGRLKGHAVMAANRGYLPGVVAFSCRTARRDLHLPELLQAVDLGPHTGQIGRGHDQASGGHLPPEPFDRLLAALGFTNASGVRPGGASGEP